jgi:hypothetical protein
MNRFVFLTMLLFLAGCAQPGPRRLLPAPCDPGCDQLTPRGRWQFVHRIRFTGQAMAGDLIGVTVVDGDTLRCALLTPEGMTLFSARERQEGLEILRALPPFDRPGFAEGLLADVRTLFVHPRVMQCGRDASGQDICRYRDRRGWSVDLVPLADGCFTLRAWSGQTEETRTFASRDCALTDGYRVARHITLAAAGPRPYTLTMTLIEALPAQQSAP